MPVLRKLEQGVIEAERPFNDSIRNSNVIYYDLKALISKSNSSLVIAESEGKIVGSGHSLIKCSNPAFNHDNHAYMGFMFVDPEYRGQGINKRIIETLKNWGSAQGINDHYLEVYAKNAAAISAYQKIGFEPSLIEMKLNT